MPPLGKWPCGRQAPLGRVPPLPWGVCLNAPTRITVLFLVCSSALDVVAPITRGVTKDPETRQDQRALMWSFMWFCCTTSPLHCLCLMWCGPRCRGSQAAPAVRGRGHMGMRDKKKWMGRPGWGVGGGGLA